MQNRGQVKLHPFDPEPERTLHRLLREQREAQHRNLAIMQDIVEQDQGQEQTNRKGVIMGIMEGIRRPDHLYSLLIHSCC